MGFNAPVPRERVEAVLSQKLLEYPRFASYISKDQRRWVPVSHVDLAHHIQEVWRYSCCVVGCGMTQRAACCSSGHTTR